MSRPATATARRGSKGSCAAPTGQQPRHRSKKENPVSIARGKERTNLRHTHGATSSGCAFTFPATAGVSWRQPCDTSPTALDSSADFFSVALATFHQARCDSRAHFFSVRRASGGRDGCRQAGALTATRREPSATGGRWAAVSVTAPSPPRTQDDVIFNEPGRRTRTTRGDGGDSCAGGSAERIPAQEAALQITSLVSWAGSTRHDRREPGARPLIFLRRV